MIVDKITPNEFMQYEAEHSTSGKNEWLLCIDPKFSKYQIMLNEFFERDVYPTYRLDKSGNVLTGKYEDKEAIPITFSSLAERPELLSGLVNEGYVSKNDSVLAYHCESCKVWVIKDGIHRLSKWLVEKLNMKITVYEVASNDWSHATLDMPNYCKCEK